MKQRTGSDKHETTAVLRNGRVELLRLILETTGDEADTETEKQVGQDGTQDCSADDLDVGVAVGCLEQGHEQDDLDNGAKRRLEKNSKGLVGHLARELLACEAEHVGCGQHGYVVADEDGKMPFRPGKVLSK